MKDYHNCAPSPNGGLVAQEGGFRVARKRFSPEQFFASGLSGYHSHEGYL